MDEYDTIEAIYYSIDNGARIVNCSYGGDSNNQNEYNAFEDMKDAGILAVCAAGNDGWNTDIPSNANFPSCYDLDNIISVAASDQNDYLGDFSNYGLTSVDVMAPGDYIKSTVPAGTYTDATVTVETGSGTTEYPALGMAYAGTTGETGITGLAYGIRDGTSMAVPHVSGIAGLILSKNPDVGYAEVKSAIIDTVDKISSVTNKIVSGGRVNAFNALQIVRNRTGDLTCDGRVGLEDIIIALGVVSGLNTDAFSACLTTAVDVNGDARIGIEEAIYVLQKVGGLRE